MLRKTKCRNCFENKISVFSVLNFDERELLIANHTCSHYKRGEIIYKEGDRPSGLICLSEGKVKVFKEGVGGREQIVRMARPVGLIGYRALFAEDYYISSAVALEDSTICVIDKDTMIKLITGNSRFGLEIIRYIARELGIANRRTVSLTQKHIRGRLAEALLYLKDTYGYEEDEQTVAIYLSREDLASLSNMTTSNAIRTLSTFTMENMIEVDGRKIKIHDEESLERVSELG
ncbi:MAG TPA: Crp/Fnr family transcriptional regulator [Bacteroidales bacterium]|nr:Crp/Fnr family transcriptional regulator [Bacteroidales bacterium]